jgi:hypothetical protein
MKCVHRCEDEDRYDNGMHPRILIGRAKLRCQPYYSAAWVCAYQSLSVELELAQVVLVSEASYRSQ